jgi:ABC-type transport system involved in multi-copper enzyme maturation permease subunit
LTWKAALRFKLFLVIASLLVLAVVGLPLVIQDDGSAQGFTQIILTYTLSTITALLGLSTLWLACGTLARDIEECQIQVVATKPVARWQIWLGKWLGIVSLNAALLALSGGCVYGLLQYRASKLPPAVQTALREQVLVARGSAKEASHDAELEDATDRILKEKIKSATIESKADVVELRNQIRETLRADSQVVPPSYARTWKIDLGFAKNHLGGKPLQLRIKFNTASGTSTGTFDAYWQVGDPPKTKLWRNEEPMSLAPDTFHEFAIPADLFDENGVLTVRFINPPNNNTALLFSPQDGMEVLYPEGGFALNYARGLGVILCWMALLAALGLAAASELSFPVAAFFALAMLLVVFSSGTLAESVESGSVAAGNAEKGIAGHSIADGVLIPAFKGVLAVVSLAKNYSPIDALSTGRSITWGELGQAFTQIVLVLGGAFALVGIVLFSRRELATAQGTQ